MEQLQKLIDELVEQGLSIEEAIRKILDNPDDIKNIIGQTGNITNGILDIIKAIAGLFEDPRAKELLAKYELLEKALESKKQEVKQVVEGGGTLKL